MNNTLTKSILRGLANSDPFDYPTLDDFCISMVYSVKKAFDLEFPDFLKADAFELDHFHMTVLEPLKENPFMSFLGTGAFSSVFSLNNSDKAFKINVASCDSFADSWFYFAEKIIGCDIKNPWLPNVYSLFRQGEIYGAIVDRLIPISECDITFQKKIVLGIKNIISTIEKADFKNFKLEQIYIGNILEHYKKPDSSKQILNAIEMILSIKNKTRAEFDIFPPNIMVDKDNNIVINDPLSYDKSCIQK